MKIAVCIKQVPQTTNVKIDPETHTLVRQGVESQINPFDVYALEEAVRVKERLAERGIAATVTVISMGPPQVDAALREAITLGADEAILLSDRAFAGADTWATSFALAAALKAIAADLVFCGMQAIDGDTAQTGPGITVHANFALATYVSKIDEIDEKGRKSGACWKKDTNTARSNSRRSSRWSRRLMSRARRPFAAKCARNQRKSRSGPPRAWVSMRRSAVYAAARRR